MILNHILLGMYIAPLLLTVSTTKQSNQDELYRTSLTKMIHGLNWDKQPPTVKGNLASKEMEIWIMNVTDLKVKKFNATEYHKEILPHRPQKTDDKKKNKGQSGRQIQPESTSTTRARINMEIQRLVTNKNNKSFKPSSLGVPEVIYPEIVIYVHPLFGNPFETYFDMETYILTLMNGVDLNFRTMHSPKIRLIISAIVLLEWESLSDHEEKQLIKNFGKYADDYSRESGINSDIDILIVGNKSLIRDTVFGGYVIPCSACAKYDSTNTDLVFQPTSLVTIFDDTMFSGILTLTHDLALLFCSISIIAGNLTEEVKIVCPAIEDLLLEPNKSNHFFFSLCEKRSMSLFFSSKKSDCFRNYPIDNEADSIYERKLPGQLLSLEQQCRKAGYDKLTAVNDTVCNNILCGFQNGSEHVVPVPALVGSTCGLNKYCILGECVSSKKQQEIHRKTFSTSTSTKKRYNKEAYNINKKSIKNLKPHHNKVDRTTSSTTLSTAETKENTQPETTPTSGSKSDKTSNKFFLFSFFFSAIGLSKDYQTYFTLIFWMVKEYLFLY